MSRKRAQISAIASVILMAGSLAGCGSSDDKAGASDKEPKMPAGSVMEKLQQKGSITIATQQDRPLFGQLNPMTKDLDGLDPELGRAIAKRIFGNDDHIKWIVLSPQARETAIQQNKVDLVLSTYTITPDRQKLVSFAGPYFYTTQDIMVDSDNKAFGDTIADVRDLNGHKVCSTANGTGYNLVKEVAPQAELVGFTSIDKCVSVLRQGRVEAVTTDSGTIIGLVADSDGKYRRVENTSGEPQPYGIGVKKSADNGFCSWVNEQLKDMVSNGELEKIYKDTIGTALDELPELPSAEDFKYC